MMLFSVFHAVVVASSPDQNNKKGLKAGLCLTAGSKSKLVDGEMRLRRILLKAPTFANISVVLARNLTRQIQECGRADLRNEALQLAERGL